MKTLQEVKDLYKSVFYLEDDMIIDVVLATCISTRLAGDPIWLLIVGAPSSGKSELIQALDKVSFVYPISSMTENTFLSNMRLADGQEASLLKRIGSTGMITMKDYTSILAMRSEKKEIIVSQMREIFDGKLTKESGNGNSQKWEGKINWIGAVTDAIYTKEGESGGMGRRTIGYTMPQQHRINTAKAASRNTRDIAAKRLSIQVAFDAYISHVVHNFDGNVPELSVEIEDTLIHLADLSTQARTTVERNYMGKMTFVHDAEMPMRVFSQIKKVLEVMMYINQNTEPTPEQMKTAYRLGIDAIPKVRKMVLRVLAGHKGVTSKGVAHILGYPTEVMRDTLEDLNVLKVVDRYQERSGGIDLWKLKPEFKEAMIKFDGIVQVSDSIAQDKDENAGSAYINPIWAAMGTDDPGVIKEQESKQNEMFNSL